MASTAAEEAHTNNNGALEAEAKANGTATDDAGPSTTSRGANIDNSTILPTDTRAPSSRLPHVPRDARLMALILQSMGIQDVQPPALMMLLEFAHRYLYEILQDAIVYADHASSGRTSAAGVSNLSLDDIQLAIQSKVNHSYTKPPNKDLLLSLASSINSVPLPPIMDRYGVKLPPTQHCLTNVNFTIVPKPPPKDASDGNFAGEDELEAKVSSDTQAVVDEEADGDDLIDTTMASETQTPDEQQATQRGTKRTLDEDEDYD